MSGRQFAFTVGCAVALLAAGTTEVSADGMVKALRGYWGSLQERSQEAIIIGRSPARGAPLVEDLILKIAVKGKVNGFAWVVPFPNEPTVKKAEAKLFRELFDYVKSKTRPPVKKFSKKTGGFGTGGGGPAVDVLSRKVVGSYEVALVRENANGALNQWLDENGYQSVTNGDDVFEFYRQRNYVFCCVKVTDTELQHSESADLHPLHFTFQTGGVDGLYFPMLLTGLQEEPFGVNLYVLSVPRLNARHVKFGYESRGFRLRYASKNKFPLDNHRVESVLGLLRELHPRTRFYLTNIYVQRLSPASIQEWDNDLWLFPLYGSRSRRFIPYDARRDGPAYVK